MPSAPVTKVRETRETHPARFVVPALNEEVRAIGGTYSYLKREVLPLEGRELLYLVGASLIDTSCCGVGGCGFALVAGWLAEPGASESRGSLVVHITDPDERRLLTHLLREKELVQELRFWSPEEVNP